jgi:hypothetical protein
LGDLVIHDSPSSWRFVPPPSSHDSSWELKYVRCYQPVPVILKWHHWKASVQLASCTLGLPSDGITPRGGVSGYRLCSIGFNLTNNWLPTPG